ncbi:hypothetical protein Patl1_32473 [Pistacia atlantica]|uniref:Uncharacterized protein n=1 Tax=Pistacia atlantica TaxID=434234 RepID=A0ACC1AQM9_9ROSI|nr:hypothetical protein Patl1_32473 [Pistacia atlantica]
MPSSPSPMDSITSTFHHLLNHSTILHFTWSLPLTFASLPYFLFLTFLTYLSLTFLFSHYFPLFFLPPHFLKAISALHDLLRC